MALSLLQVFNGPISFTCPPLATPSLAQIPSMGTVRVRHCKMWVELLQACALMVAHGPVLCARNRNGGWLGVSVGMVARNEAPGWTPTAALLCQARAACQLCRAGPRPCASEARLLTPWNRRRATAASAPPQATPLACVRREGHRKGAPRGRLAALGPQKAASYRAQTGMFVGLHEQGTSVPP